MLYKAKTLKGYKLDSLDGEMGKVKDFYFDDQHWTIRYLVADTGGWLSGRSVLISPYALVAAIKQDQHIAVDLTKKQIESSPSLLSDQPVSKQFEAEYYQHYSWPFYWTGPHVWGPFYHPLQFRQARPETRKPGKAWDPHLRSVQQVTGYHIHASDGEVGHVEDFAVDDEIWMIRYLIVDTRNWLPGRKVLVSPQWIERVSWNKSEVFVELDRESIKQSPEYTDDMLITRDREAELYSHYQLEGYWISGTPERDKSLAGG